MVSIHRHPHFVLGALLALGLAACGDAEAKEQAPLLRAVRFVVAESAAGDQTRAFSGVLRAGEQARLSFQVGGRVRERKVRVGDKLAKGAVVAKVDPTDLQLQLGEAQASVAQARAQSKNAESSYVRVKALYANQNASRQDLDQARASRDSAKAVLTAAQQGVRQLSRQLSYATLKAPAAGVVSAVAVEPNEVVSPGQVVVVMQLGEQLEVEVDLPEAAINRVARGDEVAVQLDSNPKPLVATVREVGVASPGATVFPVTATLTDAPKGARAGMAAEVTFTFKGKADAGRMVLPTTAVSEDAKGRFVYAVEGEGETGTLKRLGVKVGALRREGIEVLEGVAPGQRIVTAGVSRVHAGLQVKVPAETKPKSKATTTPASASPVPATSKEPS